MILARQGAYHGNSRGALDASHRAALTAAYEPWLGQTVRVPLVNPYRDTRTGEEHAAEIDRVVEFLGALTDEAFTPATPARVPSGLTPIGQPNRTAAVSARK